MIIHDEATYRAHPALNYSSAKSLLKSPKHFQAALNRKFEPSREMIIGSAVHSIVLEGKQPSYIVRPADIKFTTKEGKAWRDKHAGMEIVTQEDHDIVLKAAAAVQASLDAQYLLKLCPHREIGIVSNYTGVEIKGRLDAHGKDEAGKPIILDLKTTASTAPEDFGREVFKFKYAAQCAWYQSLLALELGLDEPPAWFWMVVETQEPFDVVLYQPPEEALEIGCAQMKHCIDTYKTCLATGKWPGYAKGIIQLEVPAWERKRWIK